MQLPLVVRNLLLTHQGSIVVAVSGGPDSMCMMTLVRDFWIDQGRSLSDLHVAHYHHGLRSQSDDEATLVSQIFFDCKIHIGYYQGDKTTERDLRIARHKFFSNILKEAGSTILVIGHNLTDRIETSLMNMIRGCQIRGFLNMREVETQYGEKTGGRCNEDVILLRPLLGYSKVDIQHHCDSVSIPYLIDDSNCDISVSMRNHVRQDIISHIDLQQLQNWQALYNRLESSQTSYDDPVRNDELGCYDCGVIGYWSLDYLSWLFGWSGCYADMTQGRLLERQQWIATSYQGEKQVGGRRRWIKHKRVLIVKYE